MVETRSSSRNTSVTVDPAPPSYTEVVRPKRRDHVCKKHSYSSVDFAFTVLLIVAVVCTVRVGMMYREKIEQLNYNSSLLRDHVIFINGLTSEAKELLQELKKSAVSENPFHDILNATDVDYLVTHKRIVRLMLKAIKQKEKNAKGCKTDGDSITCF
jgi:hypothetical protein